MPWATSAAVDRGHCPVANIEHGVGCGNTFWTDKTLSVLRVETQNVSRNMQSWESFSQFILPALYQLERFKGGEVIDIGVANGIEEGVFSGREER